MKSILLSFCFFFVISSTVYAQDLQLLVISAGGGGLTVSVQTGPNAPTAGSYVTDFTMAIVYPSSAGVALGTISNIAGYNVVKSGAAIPNPSNPNEILQIFQLGGLGLAEITVNWPANSLFPIFSIPYSSSTAITGDFIRLAYVGEVNGSQPNIGIDFNDNLMSVSGQISLPIHLQSFTAQKFGPNSSLLEWTSSSEDNASHYEVERSMDAQNWTYVSTEVARGSVNYKTDYSFVDSEAILQRDRINIVYYRLKLVDKDGKFEYSEVRSVSFDGKDIVSIKAYPNPTTESLSLRMSVGDTKIHDAQMQMLDMAGKLVKKQTISANGISTVELGSIEPGVYNVIVKHDNKVYQKRIIKTN